MREAVQLGAAAVEVDVADIDVDSARASGTNRAIETQKGVTFMVASVGKKVNASKTGGSSDR